jgi:dTDP-glucose 4,6-dehydratase
VDASKIKQQLGWSQRESFTSGIRLTVEWYLSNPAWIKEVTTGDYRKWITANYESRGAK